MQKDDENFLTECTIQFDILAGQFFEQGFVCAIRYIGK